LLQHDDACLWYFAGVVYSISRLMEHRRALQVCVLSCAAVFSSSWKQMQQMQQNAFAILHLQYCMPGQSRSMLCMLVIVSETCSADAADVIAAGEAAQKR
jgi:hypothetical protein